jgi:pimeloyl-ACP methyl ester carboxylesterase
MKKLVALSFAIASLIWAQAPASKQVEVFGQKIHYLEAGSGPNVILLHGLGADSTNWAMNTAVLAKSFHVFVPDQIGFGESDKPLINYRVGTLVDFLDGFYKNVGITKATVVGNSLGGWTAMAFTLAHPDKVERLVLVDSAGYSFREARRREANHRDAGWAKSVDGGGLESSPVFDSRQQVAGYRSSGGASASNAHEERRWLHH